MQRLCAVLIVSWFILLVPASGAVQESPKTVRAIAQHLEQELQAARVPGAGIVVVVADDVFSSGFGVADASAGTRMTADTLVHLGSLTKLVTALGVAASLDAKKIAVDAPVGQHLTGLSPRAASVTVHQLLTQSSGLGDRPGDKGTDDEAALAGSARQLTATDFVLPAGTVFSYSNLGYALAGATLEAIAKKPFADALRDAVLTPLGMKSATLRPAEALARKHAVGHRLTGATASPVGAPANDTRIWPAGYLWASASDFARVVTALMSQGRVDGRQALASTVVARVTTPHVSMPNVFVGGHYGYGLMIARDRGSLFYEHGGTLPGFSSIVRIAPAERVGIAILSNLDNAPLRRIAQSVMARALALGDLAPPSRQETAVTADEMQSLVGIYRNRGTAELAVRDGRVVLILDGGPAFVVSRIGENRFLARPKPDLAGPEFVLQPATSSSPAYLHFALWAYAR